MANKIRRLGQNQTVGDDNVEIVNEFTFLANKISNTNNIKQELKRRITKGNNALYALHITLKYRLIEKKRKVNVQNANKGSCHEYPIRY